jgi:hypothetical protein
MRYLELISLLPLRQESWGRYKLRDAGYIVELEFNYDIAADDAGVSSGRAWRGPVGLTRVKG